MTEGVGAMGVRRERGEGEQGLAFEDGADGAAEAGQDIVAA